MSNLIFPDSFSKLVYSFISWNYLSCWFNKFDICILKTRKLTQKIVRKLFYPFFPFAFQNETLKHLKESSKFGAQNFMDNCMDNIQSRKSPLKQKLLIVIYCWHFAAFEIFTGDIQLSYFYYWTASVSDNCDEIFQNIFSANC